MNFQDVWILLLLDVSLRLPNKNLSRRVLTFSARFFRQAFPILKRNGVKDRLDLKWRQVRISFHDESDDADDVGAGEAIACQLAVAAAGPGCAHLHAGRDDL